MTEVSSGPCQRSARLRTSTLSHASGPISGILISCPVAAVPLRIRSRRSFTSALCLPHLWDQHSGTPSSWELVKCGPNLATRVISPQLLPDKMDPALPRHLQGLEMELPCEERQTPAQTPATETGLIIFLPTLPLPHRREAEAGLEAHS